MREPLDAERLKRFMKALGEAVRAPGRVYLTGGATAVLIGWRSSTIDVDLRPVPDSDVLLRALPDLKEALRLNVELAAPSDFIPELPGWEERSAFVGQEGALAFFHYDFYAQALSKIERGHAKDLQDVGQLLQRGLVTPGRLWELFERIEPLLYRYPAVDGPRFRRAVEAAVGRGKK
jgi:hypothetical protein